MEKDRICGIGVKESDAAAVRPEGSRKLPQFLIPDFIRRATRPWRHYFDPQYSFDRKFGVDTVGSIYPGGQDVDYGSRDDDAGYQATPPEVFTRTLKSVPIDYPNFTFFDVGSGKGAVLLYASEFPFRKVIGVEYSPALCRIAERNIANYRSKAVQCKDVKCFCMDVTAFALPLEPTVFFLFNPFKGKTFEMLVANLQRSLEAAPREIVVIYYHSIARHSILDRADFLRQIEREPDHTIYANRP